LDLKNIRFDFLGGFNNGIGQTSDFHRNHIKALAHDIFCPTASKAALKAMSFVRSAMSWIIWMTLPIFSDRSPSVVSFWRKI